MAPPYGRWQICDSLIPGETPLFAAILQAGGSMTTDVSHPLSRSTH
jgi:hypothetical protein